VSAVTSLLAARTKGDPRSLQALAVALSAIMVDTPPPSTDPTVVLDEGETRGSELPRTWQEVRAARDYGDLTGPEYDYLAAAVEALTMEDR
jgi:hypothetical protein